jgi:hypothetical protein
MNVASKKQAWYINTSLFESECKKVELTGRCKKTTGGPNGCLSRYTTSVGATESAEPRHTVEIQQYLFGFKSGKYWVDKSQIHMFDSVTEEIYKCSCFNGEWL